MIFLLLILLTACGDPFDTREISASQNTIMKKFEGEWSAANPIVRFQSADSDGRIDKLDKEKAYQEIKGDLEIDQEHFNWLIEFLERDTSQFIKGIKVDNKRNVQGVFAGFKASLPSEDKEKLNEVLNILKPEHQDNIVRVDINFQSNKAYAFAEGSDNGAELTISTENWDALQLLFPGDNSKKLYHISRDKVITAEYSDKHYVSLFTAGPRLHQENILDSSGSMGPVKMEDKDFTLWTLSDEDMAIRKKVVKSYSLTKEYQLAKTNNTLVFVCYYKIRKGDKNAFVEAYRCNLNK